VVLVAADRLTVQLDRVPLPLVLAQLAHQAGLQVAGSAAAEGVLVSVSFRDLPLAEGIQRLLGHQPHVLAYARAPAAPGAPGRWRLSEIILLSKAQPPAEPAGDPGIPALEAPNPQVRIQALEQWAQQHQGDAVDPLTYALVDPDEQVRARPQALWERMLATPAGTAPPAAPPEGGGGR
jgi:HEAT repeat protein